MKRLALIVILAAGVQAGEAPNLAIVKPPAAKVSVDEAIRSAVEFLVKNQNKDGSFGHHVSGRTRELWCDVPGGHLAFRGASTALCWLGLNDSPYQTDASRAAQKRCLAWLVKHGAVKRAYQQQFYNIWPYGYGLRALGQALNRKAPGAEPEAIKATMAQMIKGLRVLQSPEGGWSYLDFRAPLRKPTTSNSFTSATVMLGLFEAQKAGVEVPQKMIDRATRYMWTTRTPTGNYTYSHGWRMRPAGLINLAQGSSMRNTACNLALHLYDKKKLDQAQLRRGLKQLVKHHRFAIIALRRPRPHESHYSVSGYFYLYGQHYAALSLGYMPEADQRIYWPHVVDYILKTRQPDGSFWDYPTYNYHKFYGTGYSLIGLSRCPKKIAATLEH